MTPRSYNTSRRQEASGERREEVLEAARQVLASEGDEAFSIEEIAKRAGVSRMTVYNLFGSKARLLEEMFDSLSQRAEFGTIGEVLAQPNPEEALDDVIALFGRFWTKSRVAHRRLNAAAVNDDELATAMASRNERRRNLLTGLTKRVLEHRKIDTTARTTGDVARALFMLSSFDSFDTLAGPDRTPVQVTSLVQRLARAVFDSIP